MAAKKGRKTREKRRKQKAEAAQTRSQQKKRELGKLEKTAKQTARMQRIAEKAKKAQARKTSKARTRARKSAGVYGGRKQQNGQKRESTATSAGRSHGKDHVKQRNQRDKGKAKNHDTVSARGHAPTESALSIVGANAKVLSHIDKRGATRMVDVSEKKVTNREATAEAYIVMEPSTLALIQVLLLDRFAPALHHVQKILLDATRQTLHLGDGALRAKPAKQPLRMMQRLHQLLEAPLRAIQLGALPRDVCAEQEIFALDRDLVGALELALGALEYLALAGDDSPDAMPFAVSV